MIPPAAASITPCWRRVGDGHFGLPSADCSSWLEGTAQLERPSGAVGRAAAPLGLPIGSGLIQSARIWELAEGSVWWPTPWLVNAIIAGASAPR